MALWDEVVTRFNTQDLVALTNAGDALSGTTVNTDRADAAVADVTGEFLTQGRGLVLDDTDAQHVSVGVEGVILRLKVFAKSGDDAAAQKWEGWKTRVRELSQYSRAARVQARTSTPSSTERKPDFERTRFVDFVPDAPPTRSDE